MKLYRSCRCTNGHGSYITLAKCIWPRNTWITGNGPYAVVSKCGQALTITLWGTAEEAQAAKRQIDITACGGSCSNKHEAIRLLLINSVELSTFAREM